jgi:hypothetical protein
MRNHLLALVAVFAGCTSPAQPPAPVQQVDPSLVVHDPKAIAGEYAANEVAANAKYFRRRISFNGIVQSPREWTSEKVTLYLDAGDAQVACTFPDEHRSEIESLRAGDVVTIRGVAGMYVAHDGRRSYLPISETVLEDAPLKRFRWKKGEPYKDWR